MINKLTFYTPYSTPLTDKQWNILSRGLTSRFRFNLTLSNPPNISKDNREIYIWFFDEDAGTNSNLISAYMNGYFQAIFN